MKTWEVIKELMEYPNKKFTSNINNPEGNTIIVDKYGHIAFENSGGTALLTSCFLKADWQEVNTDTKCDWCRFEHNQYLFREIEALNGEYPKYCPWCGNKLSK